MQICRMTEDGSYSEQLTHGIGQNRNPSVTPDGRFIVFFSTRSGSNQIWRMNANGDEPMQLTHSILSVFNPQASPDGQWLAFVSSQRGSADSEEKGEVFLVSLQTGELVQVTHTGGRVVNWRVTWGP